MMCDDAWRSYLQQEFYLVLHLFPEPIMLPWQLGALPTHNASTIYVIFFSLKVTQSVLSNPHAKLAVCLK